ncbi:FKBP-type peptidyl-prolyl cis-trans isomerase [Mucilaginibacter xinganensis]|uniref:Peptidyl-prolyl cis-trans isomerase n=1 Tax=Mucilaginibacter xinganensis TaxID=1234841 RepID=A0A223NSE2_9SPHI|nr:FKBP-type peptidyl-prolyl cis-trans isomerase [Mucilaginibacter xinganensis]ASU32757.1 FKBP-type peptidyl-prolyl cis-trans isomerase [Mucilaginibacter xinganensis]
MKYILFIFASILAVNVNAQSAMQRTPKGALYQIYTHNTGDKIKEGDIITFQYIQKTDKDSVLYSTYASGRVGQARIQPSQNVADLMEVFPLLAVNDSVLVKVPTDSLFMGHEDKRPPFFPKGSNLDFTIKILKAQSMDAFMGEMKSAEIAGADKYIADHKLNLQTTASGLKYVITQPSTKRKPVNGDTLLVNYTGKGLDDKVFDTSIEANAKAAGLQQEGRHYEPLQLAIGAGGIIAGWEEGLLLLNEGSKATFVIPSKLAYGETGYQGIAPFSTLVFDVELVKIIPAKHTATPGAKTPVKKAGYKKKTTIKKN